MANALEHLLIHRNKGCITFSKHSKHIHKQCHSAKDSIMCHRYYIFHHEPPLESRATLWHWCLLIESANISIFLLSAPWQLNHNNQHHMSCVSLEKFCPFGSRISKLNFVLGRHWALVRCIALVRLHILCQKLFSLKHCLLPKKLLQWLDCKLTINFFIPC